MTPNCSTAEVTEGVHDVMSRKFPMVPYSVIVAFTADASQWVKEAGHAVTVSALSRLVVESITFRLRLPTGDN